MDAQAQAFLDGVGDDYYRRNREAFGGRDLVSEVLGEVSVKPERILEVGCGDGWRLRKLRDKYNCQVNGIDPSREAIADGNMALGNGGSALKVGTADSLPWPDEHFDMVIFGFCLWLCEPKSWMTIAAEADRVLRIPGLLVIDDFLSAEAMRCGSLSPPEASERERATNCWFFDFPRLWLGHPSYSSAMKSVILQKLGSVFMPQACNVLVKGPAVHVNVIPAREGY